MDTERNADAKPADAVGSQENATHDPYAALRSRDFRLFVSGNFLAVLGLQMQGVAVGWEIYDRTKSTLALGMVGFVQFLPVMVLTLFTGHVADRFDRRRIVIMALCAITLAIVGLAWVSLVQAHLWLMYGFVFAISVARAFQQPARASLLPQLVPPEHFSNAVAWNTGAFHLASLAGPAIGGFLIDYFDGSTVVVFLLDAAATFAFLILLTFVRARPVVISEQKLSLDELIGGFRFLSDNPIIIGAISLDMFAVLLGGATTLLPVYAKDLLEVGPSGFGWLRAAPAIGAFAMSVLLAHRRPIERAGRALLWSVAGFGVATIMFGFSPAFGDTAILLGLAPSFWIALIMLGLTGAFDNISVVIRHTMVQVLTPDNLRGRVSAINGLFIGASNELGGFESGLVAHLFDPVISVVSGGVGTLVVVAATGMIWPQLRRYGRLGSMRSMAAEAQVATVAAVETSEKAL
jgi:MFS family permease